MYLSKKNLSFKYSITTWDNTSIGMDTLLILLNGKKYIGLWNEIHFESAIGDIKNLFELK